LADGLARFETGEVTFHDPDQLLAFQQFHAHRRLRPK
jgi:hypothetical protein